MAKKEKDLIEVANVFNLIAYKLNFRIKNSSEQLLSIDVLRDNVKKDLLQLTTKRVENIFIEAKSNQLLLLRDKKPTIINLIKDITESTLIKYYGQSVQINKEIIIKSSFIRPVLEDVKMLIDIPLSLISDKNDKAKSFQLTFTPIYDEVTDSFLEALLENLILELSNCAMSIIITEFSTVSNIRQNLYRSKFLSLRNIERFKNNLIWQLNVKKYILRPKNIYDSQYDIWVIRENGINKRFIYANRSCEMLTLRDSSLVIITYTELQDFLISRIDEFIYTLGNGIRYSLTTVVGQIIGLIWKGIIEGLKK
jgi:hypothetical protein